MTDKMRDFLKTIGSFAIFIAFFLGVVFLALLFITGGIWLSTKILPWLSRITFFVLAVDLFIILPMGGFRKTKGFSATGLIISSFVYGLTLWLWSLLLAYILWGAVAVYIGLFLAGVGVVPIAMLATAFAGEWSIFFQLIFLTFLTFGARGLGLYFAECAEEIVYESRLSKEH